MNTAGRATTGHPVIIATGEKSIDHTDFQLPGPIELVWRRQYRSGDARTHGWFGQGWSHALATELWIDDDVLRYWDDQGREVVLPAVQVGQEHFEAYEQFTLTRPAENHWALRHNQGQTHHFRQRHSLQRQLPLEVIQDRNRRRLVLQFDDGDLPARFDPAALPPRPRRLIDSAGRKLVLGWTDQQRLAEVAFESSTGRIVLATYAYGAHDGQPDLLRHTDPNGHSRTYSWEQHLLVGYTLATGHRFSNRYDRLSPTGRVVESLALDDGTGQRFEYNGRTTRVQDRLGRETVYVSNARQDIVAVHDAAGNVTRTEFDDAGRPAGRTDALGRTSITAYDSRGNLVSIVDAAGNATKVEYDALNLPTKLIDAMGGEWLRQYDERGNLTASTDPLGHTTLFEVNALGQVAGIVDALDKRKKLEWDEAGNLLSYTDCSGSITRYAYDELGYLRTVIDALGQVTEHRYDALGQLLQVTQPDGATHQYGWDGAGNLLRYVDPLGHVTAWKYNGDGAPRERVDALGHTLKYCYDAAGRLAALTNENGEHTRFNFDVLDRLTDEIGFDGRHQRYAYNAAGELTHLIEHGGSDFGPGRVTRFGRDALGRMTEKRHIGEAAGRAASSQFEYDALGRMTKASNAVSLLTFAYDPLGQLLAEKQQLHGWVGDKAFEFKHQYDPLGNRSQTVLPDGRELNHLFYGSGHLHQVNLDGRVVSNFERDGLHREVRRSQGALFSEFAYDRAGRLSAQRVLRAVAGRPEGDSGLPALDSFDFSAPAGAKDLRQVQSRLKGVIERHYRYDPSGQLLQWLDQHRGLTRYGYDSAGRITQAQIGLLKDWGPEGLAANAQGNVTGLPMAANETFHWDPASNPLPTGAAASQAASGGPYVPGNRLRVWQDARYEYDAHGNLIERLQGKRGSAAQVRTLFTWDAAHQLVQSDVARGPDETAVVQTFRYAYDALGRRVAKIDAFGTTHFGWDGDRLSWEARGKSETVHLYHPESFVPLAQVRDGELHHVHTDHLGTPQEASDEHGQLSWRATYRSWGNVLVQDIAQHEQPSRFLGQYSDGETGLHYTRFRYYDPGPGQFISQDPVGLIGGHNLVQYAPNAVNWTDPWGLCKTCPPGTMDPKKVHFMQSSAKNTTGEHTVLGNADALKAGTLDPNILRIKVWQDASGKTWTLDHRRLAAFRLADKCVPVEKATDKEVENQMWKMSTKNGGKSIRLKLGDGKSIIVS